MPQEQNYKTVLADPPWPYESPGSGPLQSSPSHRPNSWDNELAGVGSKKRYGSMQMSELKALPVEQNVRENAHLYLWTTNNFMVEAHDLAEAWGFEQKTVITWVKMCKDEFRPSMKTGYYFRGATEHLLFCVKGSLETEGDPCPTALLHERGDHSAKPDAAYELIEEKSPGPYLELFARPWNPPLFEKRPKWDAWGDEVENDVSLSTPTTAH